MYVISNRTSFFEKQGKIQYFFNCSLAQKRCLINSILLEASVCLFSFFLVLLLVVVVVFFSDFYLARLWRSKFEFLMQLALMSGLRICNLRRVVNSTCLDYQRIGETFAFFLRLALRFHSRFLFSILARMTSSKKRL